MDIKIFFITGMLVGTSLYAGYKDAGYEDAGNDGQDQLLEGSSTDPMLKDDQEREWARLQKESLSYGKPISSTEVHHITTENSLPADIDSHESHQIPTSTKDTNDQEAQELARKGHLVNQGLILPPLPKKDSHDAQIVGKIKTWDWFLDVIGLRKNYKYRIQVLKAILLHNQDFKHDDFNLEKLSALDSSNKKDQAEINRLFDKYSSFGQAAIARLNNTYTRFFKALKNKYMNAPEDSKITMDFGEGNQISYINKRGNIASAVLCVKKDIFLVRELFGTRQLVFTKAQLDDFFNGNMTLEDLEAKGFDQAQAQEKEDQPKIESQPVATESESVEGDELAGDKDVPVVNDNMPVGAKKEPAAASISTLLAPQVKKEPSLILRAHILNETLTLEKMIRFAKRPENFASNSMFDALELSPKKAYDLGVPVRLSDIDFSKYSDKEFKKIKDAFLPLLPGNDRYAKMRELGNYIRSLQQVNLKLVNSELFWQECKSLLNNVNKLDEQPATETKELLHNLRMLMLDMPYGPKYQEEVNMLMGGLRVDEISTGMINSDGSPLYKEPFQTLYMTMGKPNSNEAVTVTFDRSNCVVTGNDITKTITSKQEFIMLYNLFGDGSHSIPSSKLSKFFEGSSAWKDVVS